MIERGSVFRLFHNFSKVLAMADFIDSDEISKQGPHPNAVYSFDHPRRQTFSLPYGFSTYIDKNKSAMAYKNLVMTCKQFFARERLIVADTLKGSSKGYVFYNKEPEIFS